MDWEYFLLFLLPRVYFRERARGSKCWRGQPWASGVWRLGEGVNWGRIKAYGQSCPGLPGLVVTFLPSPSPANKSPVCLFVTMETPALPPCRAPGPVLCSSESCSLTLQGMALSLFCPSWGTPESESTRLLCHPSWAWEAALRGHRMLFGIGMGLRDGCARMCVRHRGVRQ